MIKAIKKRRSIRDYKDIEIEEEKINEILKAAMFSPSARHQYPWEFVVVRDKEKREKLGKATSWSSFAAEAPVVIAVLGDKNKSEEVIEDCSIAAEHMLLEIENQGLSSCWIQIRGNYYPTGEGNTSAEDYVRELFQILEKYMVLCLIPVGFPAEEKSEHSDAEFKEEKVHREKF